MTNLSKARPKLKRNVVYLMSLAIVLLHLCLAEALG